MKNYVSKSEFKPKTFQYFRLVQETKKSIYITDHGKVVLKLVPYKENYDKELNELRGLVAKYEQPFDSVGEEDWEALK